MTDVAGWSTKPFGSNSLQSCTQKDEEAKRPNVSKEAEKNWVNKPNSICVFIMDMSSFENKVVDLRLWNKK